MTDVPHYAIRISVVQAVILEIPSQVEPFSPDAKKGLTHRFWVSKKKGVDRHHILTPFPKSEQTRCSRHHFSFWHAIVGTTPLCLPREVQIPDK